jgi:hypothetical protein
METTMYELERQHDDLNRQNCDMSEEFLKLQTRTMKDNLLFTGIPETADETTEVAVKNFIHNQLIIDENMLLIVSVRGTMAVHALL